MLEKRGKLTEEDCKKLRETLDKMEENYGEKETYKWLRQAYVSQEEAVCSLRGTIDELRQLCLNNFPASRPMSVKEAQLLNVCRYCRKNADPAPDNPLLLCYGEEYAHKLCLPAPKGAVKTYLSLSKDQQERAKKEIEAFSVCYVWCVPNLMFETVERLVLAGLPGLKIYSQEGWLVVGTGRDVECCAKIRAVDVVRIYAQDVQEADKYS